MNTITEEFDSPESFDALKVLVIDDSKTIRRTAELLLAEQGCSVLTAKDGFESLSIIASENPDVLFIDIVMPRLDGYQTCSLIKANPDYAHIPVIMLSSKDSIFDMLKGRLAGSETYITKPFTREDLSAAIKQHVLGAALTTGVVANAVADDIASDDDALNELPENAVEVSEEDFFEGDIAEEESLIDALQDEVNETVDNVELAAESVIDKTKAVTEGVVDEIQEETSEWTESIASATENVVEQAQSKTEEVVDDIKSFAEDSVAKVGSTTDDIFDSFSDVLDELSPQDDDDENKQKASLEHDSNLENVDINAFDKPSGDLPSSDSEVLFDSLNDVPPLTSEVTLDASDDDLFDSLGDDISPLETETKLDLSNHADDELFDSLNEDLKPLSSEKTAGVQTDKSVDLSSTLDEDLTLESPATGLDISLDDHPSDDLYGLSGQDIAPLEAGVDIDISDTPSDELLESMNTDLDLVSLDTDLELSDGAIDHAFDVKENGLSDSDIHEEPNKSEQATLPELEDFLNLELDISDLDSKPRS